jgi:Amt family ammonium transporter
MAYSFFGSCIILFIINMIPGLSLRVPEEDEVLGIDDAEIGEFAVRTPRNLSPRSTNFCIV